MIVRATSYNLERSRAIVVEVTDHEASLGKFEIFAENYRSLLSALPLEVPVVALGMFPVRKMVGDHLPDVIQAKNGAIAKECAMRMRCRYLDISPVLAGKDGFLLPGYALQDGFHLSAAGHQVWISSLKEALR